MTVATGCHGFYIHLTLRAGKVLKVFYFFFLMFQLGRANLMGSAAELVAYATYTLIYNA